MLGSLVLFPFIGTRDRDDEVGLAVVMQDIQAAVAEAEPAEAAFGCLQGGQAAKRPGVTWLVAGHFHEGRPRLFGDLSQNAFGLCAAIEAFCKADGRKFCDPGGVRAIAVHELAVAKARCAVDDKSSVPVVAEAVLVRTALFARIRDGVDDRELRHGDP